MWWLTFLYWLRKATLHLSLRAFDPRYINCVIGLDIEGDPSSLHTRPWGHEGPENFERMKDQHGILDGTKGIMFYGLLDIVLDP